MNDIQTLFMGYQRDVRNLLSHIIELTYFYRGSIQYNEMLHVSYAERQLMSEFIKKRMDVELSKTNPNY